VKQTFDVRLALYDDQARDLIKSFLTINPMKRMTAVEARKHAFIQDDVDTNVPTVKERMIDADLMSLATLPPDRRMNTIYDLLIAQVNSKI
jgi:serine/threonine protein kinase